VIAAVSPDERPSLGHMQPSHCCCVSAPTDNRTCHEWPNHRMAKLSVSVVDRDGWMVVVGGEHEKKNSRVVEWLWRG
jgi:hypothetical protein